MLVERLHLGAYGYLHGHEVGGTNPALLKAMGCGNFAIALDTPFNAENLADTGLYWTKEPGSLAQQIRWADAHGGGLRARGWRPRSGSDHYRWEQIADAHDAFFRDTATRHGYSVKLRPSPEDVGA